MRFKRPRWSNLKNSWNNRDRVTDMFKSTTLDEWVIVLLTAWIVYVVWIN